MRYRPYGDSTAVYFVSTSYGGVAYFTAPLRAPVVRGDDATLTVFDTTSGPVAIKIGGRHLIVGAPQANGRRPIGEVFDLENDSTVSLVARDSSTPVWTTHVPSAAVGFQLNTNGDIAPGAVSHSGSTVGLFVPLSPGIRQFAFTYELPSSAFPLSLPIERPTGVVEVMLEEPTATVHAGGTRLREVAPVSTEGRTFRRFLAQDVPANSVVQIEVPHIIGAARQRVYLGVGIALLAAMVAALIVAGLRGRPRRDGSQAGAPGIDGPAVHDAGVPAGSLAESRSQVLVRTIADLDAQFEHDASPDDQTRAAYEAKRAALKAELVGALAEERRGR
jgi:hypothetical protein